MMIQVITNTGQAFKFQHTNHRANVAQCNAIMTLHYPGQTVAALNLRAPR